MFRTDALPSDRTPSSDASGAVSPVPLGVTRAQDTLFELTVDLLCIARPDGYFELLSPSWERSLGWSLEQLMSRPFVELVHPDDVERTDAEFTRLLAGDGSSKGFLNRYLCRDGSYAWLSWRSVREADGYVYASARDVTEEKANSDRAEALVRCSFNAIYGLDLERRITNWNPAAESLFGWTAEEAIGQHISIIGADPEEVDAYFKRARVAEISHLETQRVTRSGEVVDVSITISPVIDPTGALIGVSGIALDIGDRKMAEALAAQHQMELEDRVRERTAELEQRTKELQESLAELDSFAYTVSHDLRAPLRALDGFSKILIDELGDELSGDHERYLRFIRKNARGMQELVDGLLAFSRLGRQAMDIRRVAMPPLVRQALSDLGAAADRAGVTIEVGSLPDSFADPMLIKQVFVNLIGNALKFTAQKRDAHIEVGSELEGAEIVYFVRDDGIGFDQKYADKVFGVFQRLHRQEDYEGTGIGLALVHRIVERHGGRIWCEGALGQGATFFFTLGEGVDA